jgi:2-hydroxy-3-keto-5-methylthiopentenyl-1-phosphate phosphatase
MIGESCFQIDFRQKGSFRLIDNSHFGHDKSIEIRQYAKLPDSQRPIMFYAGDGVSDLSAAKETDLLFAKKGHGKALPPKDETGNWVLTTL